MVKRKTLLLLILMVTASILVVPTYACYEPEPKPKRTKLHTVLYYDLKCCVGQWFEYPNEHVVFDPEDSPKKYSLTVVVVNGDGKTTMNLTFYMRRKYDLSAYIGGLRFSEGNNTVTATTDYGWSMQYLVTR